MCGGGLRVGVLFTPEEVDKTLEEPPSLHDADDCLVLWDE